TVFKLTKSKVAAELATNPEENPIEALKVLSGRELPANVEQIKQMAEELNIPILTGGTPQTTRDAIYAEFKAGRLRRLVVSKIANFSVDLPDAAVAIQISGTFGSRQEEAQRLGRVLRPKPGENQARFYSIVSRDTVEQEFAMKRQLFLCEQGYKYAIWNLENAAAELPEENSSM